MDDRITSLAREIQRATSGVGFTGAGVSTASGIPDFRSEGGIWDDHDPHRFNIRAFRQDPGSFWDEMLDIHADAFAGDPQPNAAHDAFATLEADGHLDAIVTQNADRLHQDAGSEEVIELHGSMQEAVCQSCKARISFADAKARASAGELPPECGDCGGVFKPDGVLFGEELPQHALFEAHSLAEKSDVFIVAGSSVTVEPAASLPETAAKRGATLAIVNLQPTPADDLADYVFREDVTTVLPRLVEAVS